MMITLAEVLPSVQDQAQESDILVASKILTAVTSRSLHLGTHRAIQRFIQLKKPSIAPSKAARRNSQGQTI
jgi:hypothetical protein